jgi:hypothetical protein
MTVPSGMVAMTTGGSVQSAPRLTSVQPPEPSADWTAISVSAVL